MAIESPFAPNIDLFRGADIPTQYRAVREGAAVMDYTVAIRRAEIAGANALEFVNSVVTRDISGLKPGHAAYTAVVDDNGKMLDDCVVINTAGRVRLCGANAAVVDRLVVDAPSMGVDARDVTGEQALLAVQGPLSRQTLASLTSADLSHHAFPYYTFKEDVEVAGISVSMGRMGYTAELGFELWVENARAVELWDAVMEAGKAAGITLVVWGIVPIRLEGGLIFRKAEYDDTVSPYECGLGWTVSEAKANLRGRAVLLKDKTDARQRLITVVVDGAGETATKSAGGALMLPGTDQQVGIVTAAAVSPLLGGRTLAMARVDREHVTVGTRLAAKVDEEMVGAEIVSHPQYDPERRRARLS